MKAISLAVILAKSKHNHLSDEIMFPGGAK